MSGRYSIRDGWCRQIPLLHQILAGSRSPKDFPDPTQVSKLDDSCAVWEPLHYLFRSLLGWSNPALGLTWWYRNGKPTTDSDLLQLVTQLWGWNDAIDYYAAWVWSSTEPATGHVDKQAAFPDAAWWTQFRERSEPAWPNPYYSGNNPLHLAHSDAEPFGGIEGKPDLRQAQTLLHNEPTRRAVLIVDHIGIWRDALHRADARLPDVGNHSWYVEVFDRQYGPIGTFRKSRVTGRWFQGKHRIHMAGNIKQGSNVEA